MRRSSADLWIDAAAAEVAAASEAVRRTRRRGWRWVGICAAGLVMLAAAILVSIVIIVQSNISQSQQPFAPAACAAPVE